VFTVSGGHGLSQGQGLRFSTSSNLPTGVSSTVTYFVISTGLTSTAFEVSSTPATSTGLNTTSSGNGTQFYKTVSLDAMSGSWDDISNAALSKLAGVDTTHKIGFFTGTALEATLETPEQAGDRRLRVKGFRPVTDAASCYGAVGGRENLQATVIYSTEQPVNGKGLVPANVSTRMARGRLRIPAGTSWTFAGGVEPISVFEGER
jgi:hypothetical protein